jgi:hypothetical protein
MLRLSEAARHVVQPDGIVSTGWPAVRDTCARIEVVFDPWQDGAGRLILAKRADGLYAADTVVVSIPRQVGKTFLIGAIIFALCIINPGLTVIWTAHRFKTARETFLSMKASATRKVMGAHVDPEAIHSAAGNESINFRNGSRVIFGARERGGGRGFSEVDVLVFDEAQILTSNAMDDMVPTTNAAKNPLILLTGTPPRPVDPGEVFTLLRDAALSGDSSDTLYIELSADPSASPSDRDQWRVANPSFPYRTSERAILRMKKNLTDASFLREGLGIWDETSSGVVITNDMWVRVRDPRSHRFGEDVVFGVAVDENSDTGVKTGAVVVACLNPAGRTHLEVVEAGEGTGWIVPRLEQLRERRRPRAVVVDSSGPAGALLPDMQRMQGRLILAPLSVHRRACGAFLDAVKDRKLAHTGQQPVLSHSVAAGKRKQSEDGWVWRRAEGTAPLIAATLAHYGWMLKKPTADLGQPSQRRAVVL